MWRHRQPSTVTHTTTGNWELLTIAQSTEGSWRDPCILHTERPQAQHQSISANHCTATTYCRSSWHCWSPSLPYSLTHSARNRTSGGTGTRRSRSGRQVRMRTSTAGAQMKKRNQRSRHRLNLSQVRFHYNATPRIGIFSSVADWVWLVHSPVSSEELWQLKKVNPCFVFFHWCVCLFWFK